MQGIAAQIIKQCPFPRILGIVAAESLVSRRYPDVLWECGGVELRADGVPTDAIAGAVRDFQAEKVRREFDGPVFFTLRLRRDGGAWDDAAAPEREAVWRSLPVGACDFVDLEIEEIPGIGPSTLAALRDVGARILLSHHAFEPESAARWDEVLESMRAFAPDGVKFAVALAEESQAEALLRLAGRVAAEYPVSCVLGMGGAGSLTRLVSPLLGCPLTYGFLGDKPVAPGQLSSTAMREFFRRAAAEGTPTDASPRAWLDWAGDLWTRAGVRVERAS